MRINARLDEVRTRKLQYLRNVMQTGISEVVKQAIDLCYDKVKETHPSPAQLLQSTGFVGCGEASPHLSEAYKGELKEILKQKHDSR